MAIEHLLTQPGLRITEYTHGHYDYYEEDLRRALTYLHEKLWPEIPLPKESPITEEELGELDDRWLARNKLREEEEAKSKPKEEMKSE